MKTCPICSKDFDDALEACPRHQVAVAPVEQEDPLIGVVIKNRYQLNEIIGRGAMGAVYKATNLSDGSELAIKVLHTHLANDQESIKRFQYEAQAASSLMHPNIVRLYDVGVGPGGQPYIAMEYLDGKTLSDFMRQRKYLNTAEAVPIIRQICEALAEAHSHGVLHRDIKPVNIMLMNRFGQENFVVVLDFSIAKVIQRASDVDSTTPGMIFGSPAYMSPERFMGRGGDFRSDIYSVGIIMWQMLAGRAPFKSTDLYTLMNEHISTPPPSVKAVRPECDIPPELEASIMRALSKKEKDRQDNMKQLLSEVEEVHRNFNLARSSSAHLQAWSQATPLPANNGTNGGYGGQGTTAGANNTPEPRNNVAVQKSSAASTFDINPSAGLPAFSTDQRKSLEDSLFMSSDRQPYNKMGGVSDSAVSGIWSQSVANKAQLHAQLSEKAQVTTSREVPLRKQNQTKLLALLIVGLLGAVVIVILSMQTSEPVKAVHKQPLP